RTWHDNVAPQRVAQQAATDLAQRFQALGRFVSVVHQSLMLALGAWLAIAGSITIGAMLAATTLANNASRPWGGVLQAWRQLADARQAWRRLAPLLAAAAPAGRTTRRTGADVRVRGLSATVGGPQGRVIL